MAKRSYSTAGILETVHSIAEPLASSLGLSIWDIEYKKEGSSYVLRVFIDKEGGVAIDDCEAFSRAIDALLDAADPIDAAYCLEVSSPGLDRVLKRDSDFEQFIGSTVDVHLYKAQSGTKILTGNLLAFGGESITIEIDGEKRQLSRADISIVRLHVDF